MRKIKLTALLILVFALALALISCGEACTSHTDADSDGKCDNCGAEVKVCDEHTDGDDDGKCDVCGTAVENEKPQGGDTLTLIENGEAKFRIVTGRSIGTATRKAIDAFLDGMRDIGIKFDVVDYTSEPDDSLIEILVGTVSTRGEECNVDMHTLGPEGYIIKAYGTKILILGGTEDATAEVFNKFVKDYIGFKDGVESFDTVTVEKKKWKEEIQDKFKIESITIKGESIEGYTIAVPSSDSRYLGVAATLQDTFYSRAGIWLSIVPIADAGEKSIVFKDVEIGEAGAKGFRIFVEGTQLVIECAHNNMLEEAMEAFIGKILYASGEFKFGTNYLFEHEISKVFYEDFGAKGDGRTDDYLAIRAAHAFANEGGQSVFGKAGAVYRIESTMCDDGVFRSIPIQTNTDWCGAKFIFDDTNVGWSPGLTGSNHNYTTNIFAITNDYADFTVTPEKSEKLKAINDAGGLTFDTKKLDLGLGYPAMLTVYNNKNKCYIRYGGNANNGSSQLEIILVDAEGNIDPSTPFLFEYPTVTSVLVHRIDTKPITVQNATVESLASKINLITEYKSISRGINITRPNTTIRNIEHIITGEIPKYAVVDKDSNILEGYTRDSSGVIRDPNGNVVTDGHAVGFIGHSFGGFVNVRNTHNTLIENVIFQGRMYYLQGTYDIGVGTSNATYFKNCSQSNFFTTSGNYEVPNSGGNPAWGVSGTNYCKNFTFDGCKLARYDAHCGVVNGKIINSEVADVTLIGGGDMLIENSTIYKTSGAVVTLRADYGATFKGTITLKDVSVIDCRENGNITCIVGMQSANHWFGYKTYFPNIVIDNLYIRNVSGKSIPLASTGDFVPNATAFVYRGVKDPGIHRTDIDYPDLKCDVCELGESGHTDKHDFVDTKNLNPYTPPSFITMKNMENANFTVYVQDVPFFESTTLTGIERMK